MWGNFITSKEQAENTKINFLPDDFIGENDVYDAEKEAAELLKRFHRPPVNPWGNAGASEELSKAFGDEHWKQRLEEREPFDDGGLKKIIADALKKSMGGHSDCFRVEKNANGSTCVYLDGKIVSCRMAGADFTDAELREIKSRCACDACKNS